MKPSAWRSRLERRFEGLGHWVFRNRLKTLALMLLLVAGLASQLRKITIRTASDSFFHKNDPVLLAYNAYRDQFGHDERIMVGIHSEGIFTDAFLRKLRALHKDLEKNVPHVDDITSLINARNTRGEADELIVEDLLEHWPKHKPELDAVKARALSNPVYKNLLLSEDGKFTTIIIQLDTYSSAGAGDDVLAGFDDLEAAPAQKRKYLTDKENNKAVAAVRKAIERHKDPSFKVFLTGSSVVTSTLKRTMKRDMMKFIRLVVATIAVFLFVIFRRISGVLLPLFTVVVSVLCTIALMPLTGTPIKMPTQILPSFLLAVGVGASVHLLAIFYRRFDEIGDKEEALAHALGHSGLPIVMTSLTTAAGLGSFSMAEIAPIADLGRFAAAGVMVSLLFTIVLLPALLSLCPLRRRRRRAGGRSLMDRVLLGTADFAVGHAKGIAVVSFLLIVICGVSVSQLRFSHNQLEWFPESSPIRRSTETIDKALKGSISMMVVVDTGRENGLHDPELLSKLDTLCMELETMRGDGYFVGKTWSLPTILKEINRALNENRSEFYTVPTNKTLIAQELLLFENSGSDDLEDVVDSQFSKLRVAMKLPWVDAVKYEEIIERVRGAFEETLGESARITVTGVTPLMGRAFSASIESSAKSYVIAFGAITVMMIVLIGSFRVGIVSMIPNVLPILFAMAIMRPTGMQLDMFTMLVGSIALGLAVDDTIHFVHNFRRYHQQTGDPREAVRLTLTTTGRAMLTTSIVLSIGFLVYMFAYMTNMVNFGLLVGTAIIVALLADFFLAPALMVLMAGRGKTKPLENRE